MVRSSSEGFSSLYILAECTSICIPKLRTQMKKTMFLKAPRFLLALSFLVIFFSTLSLEATLPLEEVQALRDIGETLGKKDWDFNVDPCSGTNGWAFPNNAKGFENAVTCDRTCSNNTECHVVSIVLKSLNLPGTLPRDLSGLPCLKEFDVTRNFLNGTIPPEWSSTILVNISLNGNRLTGPIPKEFANIRTLRSLTIEFNQLSGPLPPELGNWPSIERFHITSNFFNGALPATFEKLTTLKDVRMGDNNFTGKIPKFIQNWTNLEKLVIQASGLQGPIPSVIASLGNMTDLRISDLNGTEATFPPLSTMNKLKRLILRSCNLVGPIPDYIGDLTQLRTLDLSFNKLTGEVPQSFSKLNSLNVLFLTGNLLNGTVPEWMQQRNIQIDLSYNDFTNESSSTCEWNQVNLFASSEKGNVTGMVTCLRNFKCPKNYYFVRINCGGMQITLDRNAKYEDDTAATEASTFHQSTFTNWAFSSTGIFLDDERPNPGYIANDQENVLRLPTQDSQLYKDARISPLSLTYYAFCLGTGSYNVNLHFAEIMFKDDKTYYSLGRRYFDVYVQGRLELKDFNIVNEAGGVGKEVIKSIPLNITSGTLEIRFHWAGRGTTDIPSKGTYGPLISAISVIPNFDAPSENTNTIPKGAVAGIVVAVVTVVLLVLGILWLKGCFSKKATENEDLKSLRLQIGSFTLKQIRVATNNFNDDNKIGEGGFGSVYKGILPDGTVVAVKQLSSKSRQGTREFINEIGVISALQHPHLVKLFGCCVEGSQLLLIYEYMDNNSLANALFGHCLHLDWATRYNICLGIARGLAYLHEESRVKIVHRDIKATNVLLDANFISKISDFGLAKLDEEEYTHISTRIAGTYGYMAPEYAMHGYLTDKADVYSFGIVALEIVSGRSNTSVRTKEHCFYLLDWARILKEKENILEMVDPRLGSDFDKEQVIVMINVALLCTSVTSTDRPTMSVVVSMLEGKVDVKKVTLDLLVPIDEMKALRKKYDLLEDSSAYSSQSQGTSTTGPSVAFTNASDLYPLKLDSDY